MIYLGDFPADQAVYFMWNTNDSNGASITRSVDGTVSVYKDNSDGSSFNQTQVTTGVTNDEDVDTLTGVHSCCITTTDAWYETGHDYTVVLSAATIDTQTVNVVLAHFSIENRFMRGTDSAALAATALTNATWTDAKAGHIDAPISTVDTVVDGIQTDLDNAVDGLGAIKTSVDACNTVVPDAAGTAPTAAEIRTEMEGVGTKLTNALDDTNELQTNQGNWATATTVALNAQGKLDVNAECDTALVDIKLDHLIAVADGDDPVNDSIIAKMAASDGDWSGFAKADDSLEAIRDRGDSAWTTGAGGSPPTTLQNTTIATLASQTSFTLTAGSADDNAYKGAIIVVEDSVTATQKAVGRISAYTGATKTITLQEDPGVFTMAVGDTVDVIADDKMFIDYTTAKAAFLDHSIATVDTVADGIQTDLDNAVDGLGAIKTAVDACNTVVPDAAGTAPTVGEIRTEMEGVGTKLTNALDDTNELQTNQGNWATATTVALNAQGKLDVNAECDGAFTTYDPPTKTEMDTAFTQIKGATWAAGTDTLEHIRNKQTDIETDVGTVDTVVDGIQTDLDNAADGLGAIKTAVDACNTVVPDAAGTAPTAVEIRQEMDNNSADLNDILGDTNELQTNQGNWLTATSVDMASISGDSGAADNLEATYDGTGYTNDSAPSTQEQVGRLASGSAAINTTVESFTKSGAEPETNTYTSTVSLDSTFHIVEDVVGATDCYYQFDVGGNGTPVSIAWQGYANSQGDSYTIWAYNYGTSAYEQIGTIDCVNGTTLREEIFSLSNAHVGTGANVGKVRFRFLSADGTAFATDRLLCAYAIVTKSVGYAEGAIWVNTLGSNTNTEDYVDGTADNPVSTWTAAKTLSASMGIKKFHIVNGSSITLDANCDNFTFTGYEYNIALGGQSLENAHIDNATVTGIGTAGVGEIHFDRCHIGTSTVGKSYITECGIYGTITVSDVATYTFDRCYNAADGSVPPVVDFGGAVGNTHCAFRNWQGGIEVANLGTSGTDVFSLTGKGKLFIASTCAAGTIKLVGHFTVTDNVVGGFSGTTADDARFDVAQVKDECDTALTDINLDHLIKSAVDVDWATTVHLDSVLGHIADVGAAATFDRTTDALEALRNRGDAAWDTATGFSTHSAADVKTAIEAAGSSIAQILADTGELQTDWVNGGRLDNLLDACNTVIPDAAGVAPTAAEIKTELEQAGSTLAQILDDTDDIGIAGAGLTALGGMTAGMKAEIESECNDALVALKLDHLIAVADGDDPVNNSIIAQLAASDGDWSGFAKADDSLEAIRDRGDAAWSAAAGTPSVLIDTTINAITDQTHFTLVAGSDVDDAYKDQAIVMYDVTNSDFPSVRKCSAYTGATKTVTLDSAPDFTIAAADKVKVFVTAPGTTAPTVGEIRTEMEGAGTKLSEVLTDTGTTLPATLTTIDGKVDTVDGIVDNILLDTNAIDVLTESGGSGDLAAMTSSLSTHSSIMESGGSGDLAAIKAQVEAVLDINRDSGSVAVTSAETTLFEDAAPGKNKIGVVVKIDMAALQAGDTFILREKYKDESGGSYQTIDDMTYTGAQTNPLRVIALTPYRYGAIITMQKTAGTDRSIEWESFVGE